MKTIIKLTNEYASNLNALFLNFSSELTSYYDMFSFIFRDCIISNDEKILKDEYSKIVDIVFISINNDLSFKNVNDLEKFIQLLRKENELLSVYVIENHITDLKIVDMINSCYNLDGSLPVPFQRDSTYKFLYRVLKKLIILKDMSQYIEDLENQLFIISTETVKEQATKQVKKIEKNREYDIRYSQPEKISAIEFMNSLDDNIIDKVENMAMELDTLLSIVYRLEDSDASGSVTILKKEIIPIIKNVFILVDSIGYFDITARAFETLNTFLETLSEHEFENEAGKNLFITMFLSIINDLEKWLQVIFIDKSTEDIHYLEASFSSNILEIEQVFLDDDNDDDDDDDLEFF